MATHSSVLAWRIPGMVEPGGCCLWGRTESDTTEATQQQQQQQEATGDMCEDEECHLTLTLYSGCWIIECRVKVRCGEITQEVTAVIQVTDGGGLDQGGG